MNKSTTVNERFSALLAALHKNPNSFSKAVGKTYTAIESICKGRTKPGFDMLEATLETFPEVNPNWLLAGEGTMFRSQEKENVDETSKYLKEHLATLEQNFTRLASQLETKDHQLESKDDQIKSLTRMLESVLGKPNGVAVGRSEIRKHPATLLLEQQELAFA